METMMYDKYLETVYPHSEASPSVYVDNDIKWGELGKVPLITCSLIPTPQASPNNLEKGVVTQKCPYVLSQHIM